MMRRAVRSQEVDDLIYEDLEREPRVDALVIPFRTRVIELDGWWRLREDLWIRVPVRLLVRWIEGKLGFSSADCADAAVSCQRDLGLDPYVQTLHTFRRSRSSHTGRRGS